MPVSGGVGQFSNTVIWREQACLPLCRPPASRSIIPVILNPIANSLAIVNNHNTQVIHTGSGVYTVEKTGGVDTARDAGAVSSVGITGDFVLRIKNIAFGTFGWVVGVNSDPLTDDSYTSMDFCWFYTGTWTIYEEAVGFIGSGLADATYAWIWRTGTTLGYGRGADLATAQASPDRTTTSTGTLYFDSSVPDIGEKFEALFYTIVADAITGSTSLTFTPSATLTGKGALTGSSSVTFSPSATITGKGALTGSSSLVFSPSATLLGRGALTGASTLVFSPAATVSGKGALTGTSSLSFVPSGTLTGRGALAGSSSLTFIGAGTLTAAGGVDQITGTTSLTFSASGNVVGIASLTGSASLVLSLSGTVSPSTWTTVYPEASAFSNDNPVSTTWTEVAAETDDFTESVPNNGSWTVTPPNTGTWD